MNRALSLLAILLFGASLADAAPRDAVQSELLGTTELSHGRDTDVIDVRGPCPSPGNRPVRAIFLQVRDGSAYVEKVGLRYQRGETQYIPINLHLESGQSTSPIDLPGEAQCVDEILVVGRSVEARTTVEFFGFRSFPPASAPVQPHATVLASTPLNYRDDMDVLRLPPCGTLANPPVRSVQVRVRGNAAEIDYVLLGLENGESQRLDVRSYFEPNTASRVLDLAGQVRCVQTVRIVGQTARRDGPQAVVELLGFSQGVEPVPGGRYGDDGRRGHGRDRYDDDDDDDDHRHGGRLFRAVVLGDTELRHREDSDVVAFPRVCDLRSVRVDVMDNAAEIEYLALTFAGGEVQRLGFHSLFPPGASSRTIDLAGDARCVQAFQVVGRTVERGPRATVRVIGFRGTPGPALQPKFLGKTKISSRKDTDLVPVAHTCRVRAVQLVVKDARVKVDQLTILFADGRSQQMALHAKFKGASPVFDLEGRARCVTGFRIVGKADAEYGGILPEEARVDLIGFTE
ncbi:MAG: DUF2541 family protein [Deltaproteobacteria bacterium]|nr:DUF2541 family protein [Deltaproteobacteria bacterium]